MSGCCGITRVATSRPSADGNVGPYYSQAPIGLNPSSDRLALPKDLDLGGGKPDEDIYELGKLNVWSDEEKEGVVVDGQSGSIEHTGPITRVSDARVKQSVESVEDALETVQELDGVEYE